MRRNERRVIYTTEITEDSLNSVKEEWKDNGNDGPIPENTLWNWASDDNLHWLNCEKQNLDIPTDGRIIALGSVGTWQGRFPGYKILEYNINSIFDVGSNSDCECEFYMENGRVWADMHHHDGTNYVEFRELREDTDLRKFLDMFCHEQETDADIHKHTRSIARRVAKVYGW